METIIIVAAIIAFLAWRMKPVKGLKTISTAELKSILNDQDKVFIDVRTPREFK